MIKGNEILKPKTRAGAASLALSADWVVNWGILLLGTATPLTAVVCLCQRRGGGIWRILMLHFEDTRAYILGEKE